MEQHTKTSMLQQVSNNSYVCFSILKGWMTRRIFLAHQNQSRNLSEPSALKSALKMAKLAPSGERIKKGGA